jgi:DNA repair protein RecO (recombination protein O)
MKQILTRGIILGRTDYGEADRILTFLTPDQGKLRLMAKGVRRVKSKLAGGIELFSISDITFLAGKRDIGTLVSSRLDKHFGRIVGDINTVQAGYDVIKLVDKNTEDSPEPEYFDLLTAAFGALDAGTQPELVRIWSVAQLLRIGGHAPNLQTDNQGKKLTADVQYNFDSDAMAFAPHDRGRFAANHIKFLRLLFGADTPARLQNISQLDAQLTVTIPLVNLWRQQYIR